MLPAALRGSKRLARLSLRTIHAVPFLTSRVRVEAMRMATTSCPASVLVIEDDERLREAITAFLESRGYATMPAENVEHATSLLPLVARPCLVLVDPLTTPPDWVGLFRALTLDDRVGTLPMVLVSVSAPSLLSRPVIVKRPIDFEILFRIARGTLLQCRSRAGKAHGGIRRFAPGGFLIRDAPVRPWVDTIAEPAMT